MTRPIQESNPPLQSPDITVGHGPPLVVFPGLARKPATNPLHYLALARITQRTVHVINRPLGLPRGITMPNLAACHARILAEKFAHPIDLLGISTGGAIALQLAVNHPRMIHRLIIAAAASWLGHEGRSKLRQFAEQITANRSGAKILASVLAPPRLEWLVTPMLWLAHQLDRRASPADMLATIDAEVAFDVTQQLNQIQIPTLLIAGGQDRAFPLPLVQATAAGIPSSRLIVYPRAGHLATMINRRFGPDVAEFLGNG